MAVVQISYDLVRPHKDYQAVEDAVKLLGDIRHPLLSMWWVHTNLTAPQVYDAVKNAFDGNDRVFISAVPPGGYQGYLSKEHWDWLNPRV